jgi:hypothetical protein
MADGALASSLVAYAFCMRDLTHREHLETRSYADHKALEEFYLEIIEKADDFFETFSGAHGRPKFGPYRKLTGTAREELKKFRAWIASNRKEMTDQSHLQNIIDEIVALVNRTLYKLEYLM